MARTRSLRHVPQALLIALGTALAFTLPPAVQRASVEGRVLHQPAMNIEPVKLEEEEGKLSASEAVPRVTKPSMEAIDIPAVRAFDIDAPLIDPWSEAEECSIDSPAGCVPGLELFKKLAREDYYMAEAIWAGLFASIGVSVGMNLVRAVIVSAAVPPPH